ncbi:MAG TPA: Lrp/AsnC ligand binding domain-containing protein [Myxococcota bacterium]|nr:Lrp/AsnC ligand binding domain-containing protein [Myxococcota bacterium]HRY95235.1 Lrp/AsnC ligand binding domain-containing protein [Myxococcota bacterium]HSA20747.1 Lrp/AsnC ligand binding domain-containing protein [Myxococcota bacterium]
MSAKAYVFIEGAAGTIPAIQRRINRIQGVQSCMAVTGHFDLVALVEGESEVALSKISYSQIQMIEGVIRTVTCNVIEL